VAVAVRTLARARSISLPISTLVLLGLVIAVTLAPLVSISLAGWAPGTEVLFAVAIVAILLAFGLSRRGIRDRWIVVIGAVSDLAVAYVVASEAFPGPIDAVGNFVGLFGDTVQWVQLRQAGDLAAEQPIGAAVGETWQLLQDMYFRLESWFASAFSFQVNRDNIVFLFWMTMAAWGMGYVGAWAAFRRRSPLLALFPGTLAIGVNITYIGADWLPFAVFLFAALALVVQVRMRALEHKWATTQTDYSASLGGSVVGTSLAVITLVVLLVLVMPRASGNPVAEAFWAYLGDGWANVEAGIQRLFGGVSNPSGSAAAGRENLPLSGPQPFSSGGTLIIETTAPSYWRGQTFGVYTGQGWRSSYRQLSERAPNEPVTAEFELKARRPSRSNIEILDFNGTMLYAPGDVVRLNRRYVVQVERDGTTSPDFASVRSTRRIGQRLVYSVDSSIAAATVAELRGAGTDYPDWIQRYLDLPALPPRTRELARRIAEAGETPYDRAQAVEFFMRRFPYAADIPPLPTDRDATDFFLFDLRRGYSSQIASVTAVLMRAMGVPARVATGYRQGTFDAATSRYVVNPDDSHTWVEAYFPSYGWVTFEPSGFRLPVVRSTPGVGGGGAGAAGPGASDYFSMEEFLDDLDDEIGLGSFVPLQPEAENALLTLLGNLSGPVLVLGALVGLAGFAFATFAVVSMVRDRLLDPKTSVQRTYRRMLRYSKRAGYNPRVAQTPREVGRWLTGELFRQRNGSTSLMPAGYAPPEVLTESYVRATYSRHGVSRTERAAVDRAWKQIRGRLVRRTLRPARLRRTAAAAESA